MEATVSGLNLCAWELYSCVARYNHGVKIIIKNQFYTTELNHYTFTNLPSVLIPRVNHDKQL